MCTRRIVEHEGRSIDREKLMILTCFEEGIGKEQARKLTPYCKKHQVLLKRDGVYEFISKKA